MRRAVSKYFSRKFILALLFTGFGCGGLIVGKLDGGNFVTLAGLVLGAFGAADAAINWAHRGKGDPDT